MRLKRFSCRKLSEVSLCWVLGLHLVTLLGNVMGSALDITAMVPEPCDTTAPKTGNKNALGPVLNSTALLSELSQTIVPKNRVETAIDLLTISTSLLAQIFVANTADVFPTLTFLQLTPSLRRVKLDVFDRSDIVNHMPYGNSSNGLPKSFQGIWWTDGLGDNGEAFSGAGEYDVTKRKLLIVPTSDRSLAFTATNSTWLGSFWSVSGAATYNAAFFVTNAFDITFNEEFTFGQIIFVLRILGVPISLPSWLVNITQTRVDEDTWQRKTSAFFGLIDLPSSDYLLKRIITGNGSKGSWFNRGWLNYKNGSKIAVGYTVFPI